MRSIPDAVQHTIEQDGFLHFGLSSNVLNLSKVARFIKPLIESRTKKRVSTSAITMALSRLKFKKKLKNAELKAVRLNGITMHKSLSEITYEKTSENMHALEDVERSARRSGHYFVAALGVHELTIITNTVTLAGMKKHFPTRPRSVVEDLAAVSVSFDEKYINQTGMVYTLIQQVTFQNINVIEFSSTYTELTFYVKNKDLKLAFDTLYDQFM